MITLLKTVMGLSFLLGISLLLPFTLTYADDAPTASEVKVVDAVINETKNDTNKTETTDTESVQKIKVYGWELMSDLERNDYETKIGSLKTDIDRDKFKIEHNSKMKARAKTIGVVLPEQPTEK